LKKNALLPGKRQKKPNAPRGHSCSSSIDFQALIVRPLVVLVMGVSGVGKTTLAQALAAALGWPFQEGDALHPPENVAKMAAGVALSDDDRGPWLDRIKAWIAARREAGEPGVITCSALKRAYRDRILGSAAERLGVALVFLAAPEAVIAARLARRRGHFMPPTLLASQFATLEAPGPAEHPLVVDATQPPAAMAAEALALLAAVDG